MQYTVIDYGKPDYVSYMFWFSQNGISNYVCSEYVLRWQIIFILIRNAAHTPNSKTRYYAHVIPFYDMDDRYVVDAGSSSWFEVHIIPGRSILI